MSIPLRVVKLGGSLLSMPDLLPRLQDWLAWQSPAQNVLIVGGGAAADVVRQLDRLHDVGEVPAHWFCVRMMSVQAEMLASLLPEATLLRPTSLAAEVDGAGKLIVLDVEPFLRGAEPTILGTPLPHGWHVTSDSIAARVAEVLLADELVLLKSILPAANTTPTEWTQAGYVDDWFPQAVAGLHRIRCVNLRDNASHCVFTC